MNELSDDSPFKEVVTADMCVTACIPSISNFFYHLTMSDFEEWGIAYANKGVLTRTVCFSVKEDGVVYPSRNNNPNELKDGYGTVRSYIPNDFKQIMSMENSVLCSIEPGVLSPVELEEGTVLGKLDGHIQSLDDVELGTIMSDVIVQTMCKTESPLVIKSHVLDLSTTGSRIAAHKFHLRPSSRPVTAQPGTIIFNSQTKVFEGYDGSEWKPLG